MKRVIYSEHVKKPHPTLKNSLYFELEKQGEADFEAWGVDFEEVNDGVGTYSTAIIKLDDGSIKNIPVENIRFIN